MPILKVYLDGHLLREHKLEEGRDFIAGRAETCDCVLENERGISRHHFKIFHTEQGWEIESQSRYGELYLQDEKIERAVLENGYMLRVPPYEFKFEDDASVYSGAATSTGVPFPDSPNSEEGNGSSGEDRTVIGQVPGVAILRLVTGQQQSQVYKLEGPGNWVGGRDYNCAIFLDNQKISHRQFEIHKSGESFLVRNLSLVNPTAVNGLPMEADQWIHLQSSDVIGAADWNLIFEIRDFSFEERVASVDPALRGSMAYEGAGSAGPIPQHEDPGAMPAAFLPPPSGGMAGGGANIPAQGMKLFGRQIAWLNPVRLIILIVLVVGGGYGIVTEFLPEPTPVAVKAQSPFDKLPIEQQQVVKQAYTLARDLYMTGRFELARQKIVEIHAIIPYYEDTQDLLKTIDVAISTQRDRDKLLAQQAEDQRQQAKVKEVIERCRALVTKMRETITSADLEGCVQEALEFDPTNADIDLLRKEVDAINQDRAIKAAQAVEYQQKVAQREKLWRKAVTTEKSGKRLTAIQDYLVVIRSQLPDPNSRKVKSQRRIASIEKDLRISQGVLLRKADAEYAKGNRKGAVLALRKAIKINPNNPKVESRINEILAELRREMQPIYHEGILEESVGNVDTARQRFTKIIEVSVIGEEYFEKAKMKMRKYGQ